MRAKRTLLLACAMCALAGAMASAQRPAISLPVIVVFHDEAPFQMYERDFQADARMSANPAAWNYQNRGVVGAVQFLERRHGFVADRVYSAALRGFAARLNARQLADVEDDPLVAYVELDGVMSIVQGPPFGPAAPPPGKGPNKDGGGGGEGGDGGGGGDVTCDAGGQTLPWGIDRVDADVSTTRAGNGCGTVSNVNVYIIDTGVDNAHPDLSFVRNVNFAGGPNNDCHGHGTHVAGTVAARDNNLNVVGVAPGAPVTGVKVLSCSGFGSTSGVISGVDWVTANAVEPAIANMSLGGGASTALDNAVINSAKSGVFYSIAAGNSGADACGASPARAGTHDGVMTTAATASNDAEASWSNYGRCVDIWAPGVSILSTARGGGTTTMSGTSMAAPHVGGGGALYLSTKTGASPASVENALKAAAPLTGTTSKDGAPIKLLNVRSF